MFAFVCGSKEGEGDGSDKENTPPPATSSPPWLKKRRLTPLSSPQDSGDDSDADILEGALTSYRYGWPWVGIRLRGFKGDRECAAAKALAYQSLNWRGSTTQFEIIYK